MPIVPVSVRGTTFYGHTTRTIPRKSVNTEAVTIRLDSSWDGLDVVVFWKNSVIEEPVTRQLDDPAQPHTIPWEVLSEIGDLRMGLVGLDGGETVKPTIWLLYGYVVEGVDPDVGSGSQPPTPNYLQQMVEQATAAANAAKEAKEASEEAAKSAGAAGPFAEEASRAAAAAKEYQGAAATSAQEAGNAKDQANTAANAAKGHADTAGTAKEAAERAAETAGNAQSGAAQSAQAAANSAQAAERAEQEAQNAAAALPAPSQEFAGMVPVVNPDGDGYIFVDTVGGVEIDDSEVKDDSTWSSRMIVDSLAYDFDIRGQSVTCIPVPGYPMEVSVQIAPHQDGEGDPGLENNRPIAGHENVTVTHNETEKTVEFGKTVYGGTFDAATGELTVTWVKYVADGTESPSLGQENTTVKRWYFAPPIPTLGNSGATSVVCSVLKTLQSESTDDTGCICSGSKLISVCLPKDAVPDANAVKKWFQDNRPEFVYRTSRTEVIQLEPIKIISLPGPNTLSSESGRIRVCGRSRNRVDKILLSETTTKEVAAFSVTEGLEGVKTIRAVIGTPAVDTNASYLRVDFYLSGKLYYVLPFTAVPRKANSQVSIKLTIKDSGVAELFINGSSNAYSITKPQMYNGFGNSANIFNVFKIATGCTIDSFAIKAYETVFPVGTNILIEGEG